MKEEDEYTEWWVYVLVSETNGQTYVGVTVDVERRLRQHNGEIVGGAKRTHRGRPWKLAKKPLRTACLRRGGARSAALTTNTPRDPSSKCGS